jgi:hypothetical protein
MFLPASFQAGRAIAQRPALSLRAFAFVVYSREFQLKPRAGAAAARRRPTAWTARGLLFSPIATHLWRCSARQQAMGSLLGQRDGNAGSAPGGGPPPPPPPPPPPSGGGGASGGSGGGGGASGGGRPVTPPPRRGGGGGLGDEEECKENSEDRFYPLGAVIECVLLHLLACRPRARFTVAHTLTAFTPPPFHTPTLRPPAACRAATASGARQKCAA